MTAFLESSETKNSEERPLTLNCIVWLFPNTTGLTLRLCGAIGVMQKFPEPGIMMGPPQLKE